MAASAASGADPGAQQRPHSVGDLLRQREALRNAHMDPDVAVERDPSVVENYRQ
jgi:hypothetical protein